MKNFKTWGFHSLLNDFNTIFKGEAVALLNEETYTPQLEITINKKTLLIALPHIRGIHSNVAFWEGQLHRIVNPQTSVVTSWDIQSLIKTFNEFFKGDAEIVLRENEIVLEEKDIEVTINDHALLISLPYIIS